ncbi:MAG: IS30 family transposase [Myxococcota bacterium]
MTMVERMTRFVILVKVDGAEPAHEADKLIEAIKTLPQALKDSLTWDRGSKMANHENVTFETEMGIYFCEPRSLWQRDSNENTNGLLRQFLH